MVKLNFYVSGMFHELYIEFENYEGISTSLQVEFWQLIQKIKCYMKAL